MATRCQVSKTKLFIIPVFVVDAYQGTGEGEDLAKGDEDGVMYLSQWWAEEARREHYAPEGAQCNSGDELDVFHYSSQDLYTSLKT